MMDYGRAEAIRREKVGRYADEQEKASARRRAAAQEPGPLGDLLDALARGLAGIGLAGRRGRRRPVRAAH
jgi:hypothetical protein